ncbi:DUF4912 domain-containing protein [Fictibacillus iocasae]|uniref:DUF4912 domain-containing protein n=1 Tax=Fictibacillus iocasae TaxID=2715437 RepID=A0ABW2NLU0_9BACL
MIEEIVKWKNEGLTLYEIAEKMNTSVGKVQYRWRQYRKQSTVPDNHQSMQEFDGKEVEWVMPAEYKEDVLYMMPQGPATIFVYWSLSESTVKVAEHHFRTSWSDLPKVIKLYDVTDVQFHGHNAHKAFEIEVPEMTNNWFLHNLEPGGTYIADVGTRTFDGSFFTLLRSNAVETSRLEEEGSTADKVRRWQSESQAEPEWLENYSVYSYYHKIR